jgi:hypothetical protein
LLFSGFLTGFGLPFHSSFRGVVYDLSTSSVTLFRFSWKSLVYCLSVTS